VRRFKFTKLVRDKIVSDIIANGNYPHWKTLSHEEYLKELKKKILEESQEILNANDKELLEEIADVQEIIDNLVIALGKTKRDLTLQQKIKNTKRGSFKRREYIEYVDVPDNDKVIQFYLGHSDKYPEIRSKDRTEKHPFGNFIPKNARYLILGSFPGKKVAGYNWFYGGKTNHFWPIIEKIYSVKLQSKEDKQQLFAKLKIAVADIILSCKRKRNNNSDANLVNIAFNKKGVSKILKNNKIEKIFFTSKFVEELFKKEFAELIAKYPKIKLIPLPSPSARYSLKSVAGKTSKYRKFLPPLKPH
jgi:hypoxanthine-DNA glycosylase